MAVRSLLRDQLLERFDDALETCLRFLGDRVDRLCLDDAEGHHRSLASTIVSAPSSRRTTLHGSSAPTDGGHDRPVSERRIVRAKDQVRRTIDIELRLHRRLDVDLGQDSEALGLERSLDSRSNLGDGPVETGPEREARERGHRVTSRGAEGDGRLTGWTVRALPAPGWIVLS